MTWFISDAVYKAILLMAASMALIQAYKLPGKKEPVIHLAHKCVNPRNNSEMGAPVIMLHGLTDVKETWEGIYQNIALFTCRRVCIYDARNHGSSSWNDTFSTDVLAEDLGNFMRTMKIEKAALVGHSLGGLTVMRFALQNPKKVDSLFVEDISPVYMPSEAAEGIKYKLKVLLDSLTVIPENADEDTAKKVVADYILKVLKDIDPERLLKVHPLRFRDGVWQWSTNFKAFQNAMQDPDAFLGKTEGKFAEKVFFIYAKSSIYKVGEQKQSILNLFTKAKFLGVESSDHRIHSVHPEFLRELIKFLK